MKSSKIFQRVLLLRTRGFATYSPQKPKQVFTDISLIRNFCIIAHIDHGKSTLADRLLEITKTITQGHTQYLDKLKVERERGITVKAQSCTMFFTSATNSQKYMLNLIDTPGHIDFNYEVSRSMRSCEGAVLLVDACQGIQAQTLSNYELALSQSLTIIPVINKIDMQGANIEGTIEEMTKSFGVKAEEILLVSAKTGKGVEGLLEEIVGKVPPPKVSNENRFKGFLVDSWFIKNKGVVMLLSVRDGQLQVGILNPEEKPQKILTAGQVGYVVTNMKTAQEARIGDTFHKENYPVEALEGFQPAKPMVFAGIYPEDIDDYMTLEKSIYKLGLTDPSVTILRESSAALGNGFRCGFLGILHMEIFKQRLEDEYKISIILTTPSVKYLCKMRNSKKMVEVENALMAPDIGEVLHYEEPIAEVLIITPTFSLSNLMNLCLDRRGFNQQMSSFDENKHLIKCEMPLSEIITDFFDKVKSLSRGYASLEYEFKRYQKAKIKKLTIIVMGEPVDALSFMVHQDRAFEVGKKLCQKLKEKIPRQLFLVTIQAKYGSRIIAREDVPYLRKNVTAKCYGGDYSRKRKLLERQKEGKKNLRKLGKVEVGKDIFMDLLRSD